MNPLGRFAHAVLVMSGIVLAVAGSGETKAAVAGSRSGDLTPATVVLRGSTLDATPPSPVTSNAPIVLRGSPARAVPGPTTGYACPPGYDYDPSYGCVAPGSAYAPYDYGYGYWPYWVFDRLHPGGRRHRFAHSFVRGTRRGAAFPFGHLPTTGFGHGFAHMSSFIHR